VIVCFFFAERTTKENKKATIVQGEGLLENLAEGQRTEKKK